MTTNKVLPDPTDPADEELDLLIAEVEADLEEVGGIGIAAYAWDMTDLLREVARPHHDGWVESEAACFQRRTKPEFEKMFQLNDGKLSCSLLGFRDTAEALLCEEAALETGSSWRYLDYIRQRKKWNGDGLGGLNIALDEYSRCYRPGLCPTDQFPAPSPKG